MSSTTDLYTVPSLIFYGKYAKIRENLNIKYNFSYTEERTSLQDEIISEIISQCNYFPPKNENPVYIFSGGIIGSGKSHTFRKFFKENVFDQSKYLCIDADKIKDFLPEYKQFKKEDPKSAGTRVHVESVYILEIIVEYALSCRMNLIVDGSLRDTYWYKQFIKYLRQEFPEYFLRIVYIRADESIVRERVAKRGDKTGRHIPDSVMTDNFQKVPNSVEILKDLVDETWYVINNTEPYIESVIINHTC